MVRRGMGACFVWVWDQWLGEVCRCWNFFVRPGLSTCHLGRIIDKRISIFDELLLFSRFFPIVVHLRGIDMNKKFLVSSLCIITALMILSFWWQRSHGWKNVVINEVKSRLIDPESLQIEFLGFLSNYKNTGCAIINTKNSFGGYTGRKLMSFSLNNDRTNATINIDDSEAKSVCSLVCNHVF